MAASQFGTNYSRFFTPVPGEEAWIPFPRPANEGQKVANARARAARAGVDIGSGYLNPKTGELQDPDRGFGRAVLSRPEIMLPLVIGSGFGVGALTGPAAASASAPSATASGVLPSSSIPTSLAMNAVPGSASTIGGGATGAMSGLGSVLPEAGGGATAASSLLDKLLSPDSLATAGTIAASLMSGGDGTNAQTRASEEQARKIQAITEARMRRVDPLHEAVTQLAFGRLPVSSRQGINLTRVALPE